MGLELALKKNQNHFYVDFNNAYWYLKDIQYGTELGIFTLAAYPNQEAKSKFMTEVEIKSNGYGSCTYPVVNNEIYSWTSEFRIRDVFPNGIPLNVNEQKTALYNFIKSYTQLPWKDVLES